MRAAAWWRVALGLAVGLALACGSGSRPDEADAVDALVARLATAGLAATRVGVVDQPFFEVRGEILAVGQEQIQVFAFPSASAATAAAATVSADGGTIGTSTVTWVAPPHFHRSETLIVLYVGVDATVLSALVRALGSQFAGR